MSYDLIIIGGGPGGYTAALKAAGYGLKTCLFEEKQLGGTCLNRGCIPTKTLVHTADLYREIPQLSSAGITAESLRLDLSALKERKEAVAQTLRDGLAKQMKAMKIDVIGAHAVIRDAHTVLAENTVYEAENILIASGSEPARLPVEGIGLPGVITSDELLDEVAAYESLVIIGGGVIGCEIAGIYASFGTRVTVLEAMDTLLPNMDSEIGRSLALIFRKRGIDVHCKAMVQKIEAGDGGLTVTFSEKNAVKTVQAEKVLCAAGRKAVTDLFEDEAPEMIRGRFVTDENGQTSIPHIYAAGDAAGTLPQLAHTAEAMGINAVCAITGRPKEKDMRLIPSGVYTSPEIACVGLNDKEAAAAGYEAVSAKANTLSNARSLIQQGERGFIRITADKTNGRILGACMMCERATDLIHEISAALKAQMTVTDLQSVIHGHPTYSEAVQSVLEALTKKLS